MNIKERIEEVIAELHQLNLNNFADDIQSAIDGGCTGTEILMEIRFQIQQIEKSNLPNPLCKKMTEITNEIEKIIS